jgi:hypothetical protein
LGAFWLVAIVDGPGDSNTSLEIGGEGTFLSMSINHHGEMDDRSEARWADRREHEEKLVTWFDFKDTTSRWLYSIRPLRCIWSCRHPSTDKIRIVWISHNCIFNLNKRTLLGTDYIARTLTLVMVILMEYNAQALAAEIIHPPLTKAVMISCEIMDPPPQTGAVRDHRILDDWSKANRWLKPDMLIRM